ncbi:MAG: methyl-accepting chemotaxis protein [Aquabacterium sp.]
MLHHTTLRQKFVAGLCIVVVVSAMVLLGVRLLGKGALFHHLEREHVARVMQMQLDLERVALAPTQHPLSKAALGGVVPPGRGLRHRQPCGCGICLGVEQWAFRLLGFGAVIDLPHKDMKDLQGMRARIESAPGDDVTPALVQQIQPDMNEVMGNSNRFGPLVVEAVDTVKVIVIAINLLGITALCSAFWVIRRATLVPLEEAVRTAQRIRDGDLVSAVPVHAHDEMGQLMQALADMKARIAAVVGDVRTRSQTVALNLDGVATGHDDLSHRTEQQAATLQQTASSVVELTTSVQHSVQAAQSADAQASSAADIAAHGGETVEQVVHRMSQILHSSKKISDIIGVIDGIAFQTNILALNAAVEAARAGEQGRGFAVVASEVRSLAQRSAAAAKEIGTLIRSSVDEVESGASLVTQAGDTMRDVVQAVREVSSQISQVSHALSEQAGGIRLIEQAMGQLDQATQQNAALAEQSAAAVQAVRQETSALVASAGQFKLN